MCSEFLFNSERTLTLLFRKEHQPYDFDKKIIKQFLLVLLFISSFNVFRSFTRTNSFN